MLHFPKLSGLPYGGQYNPSLIRPYYFNILQQIWVDFMRRITEVLVFFVWANCFKTRQLHKPLCFFTISSVPISLQKNMYLAITKEGVSYVNITNFIRDINVLIGSNVLFFDI